MMALVYTLSMWLVIIKAPEFLIGIFSSNKELLVDAVPALKLYFAAFVFMLLQYTGQTVFKSLNKKKQAIFFSLLRKVFIVVPLTYLLPYAFHFGTDGVFMAECNRWKHLLYHDALYRSAGTSEDGRNKGLIAYLFARTKSMKLAAMSDKSTSFRAASQMLA